MQSHHTLIEALTAFGVFLLFSIAILTVPDVINGKDEPLNSEVLNAVVLGSSPLNQVGATK